MQMSQMHYLPLTPGLFSILVGLLAVVILLVLASLTSPRRGLEPGPQRSS